MHLHRSSALPVRQRLASTALLLGLGAAVVGGCGSEDEQVAAEDGTTSSTEVVSTTISTTAAPTTDVPTTAVPPTTGGPACPAEDWQTIDAGDFTFQLPPGVEDQHAQGIDSQVGQYDGAGLSVNYDYGGFTNDFGDVAATGTTEEVLVSGLPGRLISSDAADTVGYGTPLVTALYVETDAGGETPDEMGAALGLSVGFADAMLLPVADCIVRSVEFVA